MGLPVVEGGGGDVGVGEAAVVEESAQLGWEGSVVVGAVGVGEVDGVNGGLVGAGHDFAGFDEDDFLHAAVQSGGAVGVLDAAAFELHDEVDVVGDLAGGEFGGDAGCSCAMVAIRSIAERARRACTVVIDAGVNCIALNTAMISEPATSPTTTTSRRIRT